MNYPKAIGGLICAALILIGDFCCAAQPNQADVEAKVKAQYETLNQKLHNPSPPTTDSETLSQIREQAQLALINSELSRQNLDRWISLMSIMFAFAGIMITLAAIAIPFLFTRDLRRKFKSQFKAINSMNDEASEHLEAIKKTRQIVEGLKINPEQKLTTEEKKAVDEVALDLQTPPAIFLRAKAFKAQEESRWEDAVTLWKSLLQFSDDPDGSIHFGLGYAYLKLNKFIEAANCFKTVNKLDPNDAHALNNWGNALGDLAKTKTGIEAEQLYNQAYAKYHQATKIDPQFTLAFSNWGYTLFLQAAIKTGVEAEQLYTQANEILQKGETIKAGSCAYNLACVKARLNNTEACRQWLETAKACGKLPDKAHLETDSDLASVRDLPWFKELLAGLS